MKKRHETLRVCILGIGYSFLYLPIASLVFFSFNASPVITSWTGFSLRWYKSLLEDAALLSAACLSLKIAVMSASAAVVMGTWSGYILARKGRFRGSVIYLTLLGAPLVIPEIVIGISLLLMFVEIRSFLNFPEKNGILTIWIGQVTVCMAFVAVIVQACINNIDRSLEEAALDLGATPKRVFFEITLPLIAPALIAAWLLSFTLSLDDVVISSFLSGPGSVTLPVEIFSRVRLGLRPEVNALATLLIFIVGVCVTAANYTNWREKTVKPK